MRLAFELKSISKSEGKTPGEFERKMPTSERPWGQKE